MFLFGVIFGYGWGIDFASAQQAMGRGQIVEELQGEDFNGHGNDNINGAIYEASGGVLGYRGILG